MSILGSGIQDVMDDIRSVKQGMSPSPVPIQPAIDTTAGIKPVPKIPSYKKGTLAVPKTGPAILHKGEQVVSKENNPMSGLADMMGGKDEKPKKVVHEIRTRKGKSGGYIHEHHHTHPGHHPMEEHVSPTQDAMVGHMMDHMGSQNPGESEADAGSEAAMSPAAGM